MLIIDKIGYAMCIVLACLWSNLAEAETISIQAKSYIAPVNLLDPNQFDNDAQSCQAAMAAVVDCGTLLGENPADGAKSSRNYRLWSEVLVDATCTGDKVATWKISPVAQDFGPEFIFISTTGDVAKPLKVVPSISGSSAVDKVTLSYRLRGRPNVAGVAVMEAVKHRSCSYIWHEVSATLTCQKGKANVAAGLLGSGFPSHKLWVGGKQAVATSQGPFKSLWKCDAIDPTAVK